MRTIFDEVNAPPVTPHLARIAWYVPLAINVLTAACTAFASPEPALVFGVAMPYGATSMALPTTLNRPADVDAM